MDEAEFEAWAKFTAQSAGNWTLDFAQMHNNGISLYYCGLPKDPSRGIYVQITPPGLDKSGEYSGAVLETGRYEDAVPHIGEAVFSTRFSQIFPTEEEAIRFAISELGMKFLSR